MNTILKLSECLQAGTPCATGTVTAISGSIPTEIGAKILVGAEGARLAGTVGGGLLESVVIKACHEALQEGKNRLFSYSLTEEEAGGLGMVCGGTLQVFIEVFAPKAQLVLVGGGHVNLALAQLAGMLGYECVVIDDRPDWANQENYPGARVLNLPIKEAFAELPLRESHCLVIATRGHRWDSEALEAALDYPARYLGMIGSKRKVLEVLKDIKARRDLTPDLPRIYAPIGLDLGGKSPMAVALSILSEIHMVLNDKTGASMREQFRTEWL